MMLTDRYYEKELKRIISLAGARYQPQTNVELPLLKHIEYFTRNENCYNEIRTLYGNIKRGLSEFIIVNDIKYKQYHEFILEKRILLKRLRRIFKYNIDTIKWNLISINIRFLKACIIEYSGLLQKELDKANDGINKNSIESKIYDFRQTLLNLNKLYDISNGINGIISNNQFLLISGSAGTGKTHLLVDVYKKRVDRKNKLPTLFLFGEQFINDTNVWVQISKQLRFNYADGRKLLTNFSKIAFEKDTQGLIIIDALNESKSAFWKNNLMNLIEAVKSYPNISIIISIRNGYDDLLTAETKKTFFEIEHHGFPQDMLWDITEKYFEQYNITYPDIPLLSPEFQNPLFLYFFCKKNRNSKILLKGGNNLKDIFEDYILDIGLEVLKYLNPESKRRIQGKNILWDFIIKQGIAPWLINNNSDTIDEKNLKAIISRFIPDYDALIILKLLENRIILNYVYTQDYIKFYKFPFNKFSDHIIVRTMLELFERKEDRIYSFKETEKTGKYLLQNKFNSGLIEAFCIQTPEFCGKELFELAPYLKNEHGFWTAFTESIIWRNPNNISAELVRLIENNLNSKKEVLLTPILNLAHIPDHPLNALLLNSILSNQKLAERDSWWSIFLNNSYLDEGSIVNRIINWSSNKNPKHKISKESIKLFSITVSWFLTSSNRYVRDKSTKSLIYLLKDQLDILSEILEHFNNVNDPYILERLYCVGYGCVLLNQSDSDGLKKMAIQTYALMFKNNSPPPHILLRDYARGIIEVALKNNIKLEINTSNINPPYKSDFPKNIPSNEDISKYEYDYKANGFKDYFWSQNSIINSMQPEHTSLRGNMYGDFGRYIFESTLSHWNISPKLTMQQLSNMAVEIIFKELKYDVETAGRFDRELNRNFSSARSAHKAERIGKKYQWIAFHKIAALIADNFAFSRKIFDNKYSDKYNGAWNLYIRDIDPTVLISPIKYQNKPLFNKTQEYYDSYNIMNQEKFEKWINSSDDLLDIRKLLEIKDDETNLWLNLNGSYSWNEETLPEEKEYYNEKRKTWTMFKSYLIKKDESTKFYEIIKNESFWGNWMPEGTTFHDIFLGEYPNSEAYDDTTNGCDDWTNDFGIKPKPHIKVLPTEMTYQSQGSLDCSYDGSYAIRIPHKEIITKMNLNSNFTGQYFKDKQLMIFENSILNPDFPNGLIGNKENIMKLLKENNYNLFWTVIMEKTLIGGNGHNRDFKPKEISLLVTLRDNGTLEVINKIEN